MKKIFAVVIALCVSSALFALDVSAGSMLDYSFQGATVTKSSGIGINTQNNMGLKFFFDAQYATLSLGSSYTVGNAKQTRIIGSTTTTTESLARIHFVNLGLLGKFPFKIGSVAKIYPLFGFDLDIVKDSQNSSNNDRVWIDFGVGSDISLSSRIYLRPQALVGFHINKADGVSNTDKYLGYKIDVGIGAGYKF